MPKTCSKCGKALKDTDKFCTSCGTPVEVKRVEVNRFCRQCGNMLSQGAKFCDVCGKEAVTPKKKEEPKIEEPTTMDGITSPVIDDSTFAGLKTGTEKFDGFESAAMPGAIPEVSAPPPTPSFTMDVAVPSGSAPAPKPAPQPKPNPQPAPQAQPRVQAQAQQQYQAQPQYQHQAAPRQQMPQQPQQYAPQYGGQPNVAPVLNAGMPQQNANPYSGVPMPGQPIPTYDNKGNQKNESSAAPIILSVIIAVILIADAIVFLGPGRKNKDADDEVRIISIEQMLEE